MNPGILFSSKQLLHFLVLSEIRIIPVSLTVGYLLWHLMWVASIMYSQPDIRRHQGRAKDRERLSIKNTLCGYYSTLYSGVGKKKCFHMYFLAYPYVKVFDNI